MKTILLAMLIVSGKAFADELAYGLVTTHVIHPGHMQYSGCLESSCRTIYNPMLAYRKKQFTGDEYEAHTFLFGTNSVHDAIGGYYKSFGVQANRQAAALIIGGYLQNNQHFKDRQILPFSIAEINKIGLVPVIGAEHQYFLRKDVFTSIVLTPAIVNFGFGIAF